MSEGRKRGRPPRPLGDILRVHPVGTDTGGAVLRRALRERGKLYVCAQCGLLPIWRGGELTLQIDHINGVGWDDRFENLRFLCPNCHSQTDTYCGRNKGRGSFVRNG